MIPPTSQIPPAPSDPAAGPWFEDALEVDRHLDGEGDGAERARREADVAARPEVRARLARRSEFLESLRSARWAPAGSSADDLEALEERVRGALARAGASARAWAGWRPALVGLAAALAGLGAWLFAAGGREAEALDPVAMAAQLLSSKDADFVTCAQDAAASDVHHFVLVRDGELLIRGCPEKSPGQGASAAVLRRPEDLPVMGYIAVPASGGSAAYEVGVTEVGKGGVVVFDVLDHGRRVYLAVDPTVLKAKHAQGERWMCAACHGPARQAVVDHPHRIVLRRAP